MPLQRSLSVRLDHWPDGLHMEILPASAGLARHIDARPARQVLYPHAALARLHELLPTSRPRFQVTRYRGRVDEYDVDTRQVLVSLWEEPSGRESRFELTLQDFPKALRPPRRDMAFFLWAWFEWEEHSLCSRHWIEVPESSSRKQKHRS